MGNTTGNDWLRSLEEIEHGVGACLAALDQREARITGLFSEAGRTLADNFPVLNSNAHAAGWSERLAQLGTVLQQAEATLSEGKGDADRWCQALSTWASLVEQLPRDQTDGNAVLEAITHVTNCSHHPGGG